MITLFVLGSLTVSTAFAFDTGFSSPSFASTPGKHWKNISYSFASDNLYATATRSNKQLKLSKFTLPSIPGGSTITGIAVTVEGLTAGLQANVALSFDGGQNFTSPLLTSLTSSDSLNTLGGPSNTWGRTWSASEFTNSKFMVKLTTTGASGSAITISVDQVQVKVYYTPPPDTLALASVSGPYAGTATMSATLTVTDGGAPIPSKTIDFYVGGTGLDSSNNCTGTYVGSATTQADTGTATLVSASLSGIDAGDYPYGACASFVSDGTYQSASISADLHVIGTDTTLVAAPATGMYGGSINLSATLTLTSGGTGIKQEWITFYLFGNEVGSAQTNNSGVATLPNISLLGYDAGVSNDISASFAGAAAYNPANANAAITINQRPITVTAVSSSKVYDGTVTSSGVPTYSGGSLVTGDTASFTETFDTQHVGINKTLTPGGVVDDGNAGLNYSYTYVPVTTGTITKALLTVTADNKTMFVGGSDPTYTFQYGGLAAGDNNASIDMAPTCGVSGPHSSPSTYPILCAGGSDNDYNFSYVSGTLTVVYAHVNVAINGIDQGSGYDIAVGASNRPSYAAMNNGPVKVYSPNNAKLIASQRVIFLGMSYSEMMGLPLEQLSKEYWFPYYNNVAMNSQLRVSNLGGSSTTIKVYLGTQQIDSYTLAAGSARRWNYDGRNSGPLRVTSSNTNILATVRVLYVDSSYSEMMGLPKEQLSKEYLFPYYNDIAMNSQLRVSNVGGVNTTINVYLGSNPTPIDSYSLAAGGATRKNYGFNSGPLRVTSSASNILTTIRVLYNSSSYSEMMGLPVEKLSKEYWYPAYDNNSLDSQLRVSNVGAGPTTITVYAGTQQLESYTLAAGGATRRNYAKNTGPLHVVSSSQPILSTIRMLYLTPGYSSFYEMAGLPDTQLSTQYFFPWYNNKAMDSELRFAIP